MIYNKEMLVNLFSEVVLGAFEIALIAVFAAIALFVLIMDIYIAAAGKKMKKQTRMAFTIIAFCLVLLGIILSLVLGLYELEVFAAGFLSSLAGLYGNTAVIILHISIMLLCCIMLIILTSKSRAAVRKNNYGGGEIEAHFDTYREPAGAEIYEVKDLFKEFGNNERDVEAGIERMLEKIRQEQGAKGQKEDNQVISDLENILKMKKSAKKTSDTKNSGGRQ